MERHSALSTLRRESPLKTLPRIYLHFRIGDKKGELSQAHGLGHAYRCLHLLRYLEKKQMANCSVVINRNPESIQFVSKHRLSYFFEDEVKKWPDLWINDVNYLPEKDLQAVRKCCPLINLAPRGMPKYVAHQSFLDFFTNDYPEMQGRYETDIECGFHTILFSEELKKVKNERTKGCGVVMCMGGADASNLTMQVLHQLEGLNSSIPVQVITGRAYLFQAELDTYSKRSSLNLSFCHGSENIYQEIARAKIGIFAGGLTMYEALFLGVPSINLPITPFHNERIDKLAALELVLNAGEKVTADQVEVMLADESYAKRVSQYFSKNGLYLITETIAQHLQGKPHSPPLHPLSVSC